MSDPGTPQRSVEALFRPRSIAIVGASPTRRSARQPLQNLLNVNYPGQIAAVNPRYDEVLGVPCYESVTSLPFIPDALAVVVNSSQVVPVIEGAAAHGVKAAVVFGMGFGEAGLEGVARQRCLVDVARGAGMAVLGPNCLGMINFVESSPLFIEHLHTDYLPGRVALIAQSGSMMMALTNNRRGVRWSHVMSSGNEAVTDAADLMSYLIDDPSTDVICLFVESIRRPEQFFAECDRAFAADKPVVMLKAGRSAAGASVVTAHSGALAQPDALVSALLIRHRVLRVDSMEELLQTAIALQSPVRPTGDRLATLAPSGAQIELVLDEGERQGLRHEALACTTTSQLAALLPDFLSPRNPLDWWGLPDYKSTFVTVLKAVVEDPDIDIIVNLTDFSHGPSGRDNEYEQVAFATSLAPSGKVVAVLENLDGAVEPEVVQRGLASGVLVLSGIPTGFKALRHLIDYSAPARAAAAGVALSGDAPESLQHLTGTLTGDQGLELLHSIGLPTVQSFLVHSAGAAVSCALDLGLPVVVKSADPDHAHKTEIGAVRVGLTDAQAVKSAATDLFGLGARSLLVQQQVSGGVELILGLQTDQQLGTFVLVGMGGIWTEVMADVSIRPVGLRVGEAEEMLRSLRGYPLLSGGRGTLPLCVDKVVDMIERLDAFGSAAGHLLDALDINPVIITTDDAVAVDALVVFKDGLPGDDAYAQDPAPAVADVTGGLLTANRRVEVDEAARILKRYYGIDGALQRFTSERDDTFGVECDEGRFIFKIAHPLERADDVSLQIGLLEAIAQHDPALPVPRVIRDLSGRTHHLCEGADGRHRLVRLLSCLPGQALKDTQSDAHERFALGRMLGRLRLASAGFTHQAQTRVVAWDVQHIEMLRPLLVHQSGEHHRLLDRALERLAALKPEVDTLRRQVLHNDCNKPNILVERDAPEFVTGIIDFGDAVQTAIAIDVATAAQDHLPDDANVYPHGAIFDDAADIVRGYLDVTDLTSHELRLVPHLMMARVAAIGLITTVRAQLMPDNAPYILRTTALVWPQLRWFLERNVTDISDEFVARVQREGLGV